MIDMFVLACVLARVDASVKANGGAAATKEREILTVFAGQAKHRIQENLARIDDNDDELIKGLADHAGTHERYTWDNL
jgi:acyl-CoA dehydrogenase family protein 9